uniref:HTH CENPB-type domain-containing protein n=1 Tax=Rhizophagus irregularis (strain DAOM 181602 / DAOM 197198 / MUCL 43194) TaxID=747089 RepID=U9U643_RHIID
MPKVTTKKQYNDKVPKKRKSLTATQKKEIYLRKISKPFLKQKELANEYEVSEEMISDILKAKDRWLYIDLNNSHQSCLNISDEILKIKALEFAFLCKEEKFKGLTRWINNFKKRHNLKKYNIHGEAAGAPLQDLDAMHENLRQTLKNYALEDIFNCDETDFF